MSGGGGGVIIIRSRLRVAASDAAVQDNISTSKKGALNIILAKPDGDWSDHETHYVLRRIGEAYDNQC